MKKSILALFVAVLCLMLVSSIAEENPVITFDAEKYSVPVGKSINIKATITPKSNMKLEWSSSDESIAAVSPKGAVKGIAEGETEITAKSIDNPGLMATCKVTVVIPVKKISVSESSLNMAPGVYRQIKAMAEPENATNRDLVWSSSNDKVAMVSEDGVITAISKGSAKISVAAVDGSNVKATINVTVKDYHVVLTTPFTIKGSYKYTFQGHISIRGKVKKGNVSISDVDRDMSGGIYGGYSDGYFNITPVKAGTDVITIMAGGSRVNYDVFVAPDAFMIQELGFGKGAILENREYGVFNGHTYRLVKVKGSWSDAKEKCKEAGGHLATITSEEEQKFVDLMNANNQKLWIGLYKNGVSGWGWITKEELNYTHWANGEPNDYATREFRYENAGVTTPEWNDIHENNYNEIAGYICEWDEVVVNVDSVIEEGTIDESGSLGYLHDHTYRLINGKYSWQEAKKMCEELGGHLVTITSPDEQRFIRRLNKNESKRWIGLYKGKNGSGEWGWVTEEPYYYTYWADGEPNDYFSREFPFENAGVVSVGWMDYHEKNFGELAGFICEWDYIVENTEEIKEKEQQVVEESLIKTYKKHKYLIVEDKCSWSEAKEKCEAEGGHLVTITSEGEQQFIEQIIDGRKELWIGMRRGSYNEFFWITGEKVDYTNWGSGEPNNYGAGENSVAMRPDWNDYDENNTNNISGYICEWDEYKGDVTDVIQVDEDPDYIPKSYYFMGLTWGSTYEEVAEELAKKDIHITELAKNDIYEAYSNSYDRFKIAGEEPSAIHFIFTDEEQKLYKVECLVNSFYFFDLSEVKKSLIADFGEPKSDRFPTGDCVWEKNGVKITLSNLKNISKISLLYEYNK